MGTAADLKYGLGQPAAVAVQRKRQGDRGFKHDLLHMRRSQEGHPIRGSLPLPRGRLSSPARAHGCVLNTPVHGCSDVDALVR